MDDEDIMDGGQDLLDTTELGSSIDNTQAEGGVVDAEDTYTLSSKCQSGDSLERVKVPKCMAKSERPQHTQKAKKKLIMDYVCANCNNSYAQKQSLSRHQQICIFGVVFRCTNGCGRTYKYHNHMKRHLRDNQPCLANNQVPVAGGPTPRDLTPDKVRVNQRSWDEARARIRNRKIQSAHSVRCNGQNESVGGPDCVRNRKVEVDELGAGAVESVSPMHTVATLHKKVNEQDVPAEPEPEQTLVLKSVDLGNVTTTYNNFKKVDSPSRIRRTAGGTKRRASMKSHNDQSAYSNTANDRPVKGRPRKKRPVLSATIASPNNDHSTFPFVQVPKKLPKKYRNGANKESPVRNEVELPVTAKLSEFGAKISGLYSFQSNLCIEESTVPTSQVQHSTVAHSVGIQPKLVLDAQTKDDTIEGQETPVENSPFELAESETVPTTPNQSIEHVKQEHNEGPVDVTDENELAIKLENVTGMDYELIPMSPESVPFKFDSDQSANPQEIVITEPETRSQPKGAVPSTPSESVSPTSDDDLCKWSKNQVQNWLRDNNLEMLCEKLHTFDGEALCEYREMLRDTPQLFFDFVERQGIKDAGHVLKLSRKLKRL